MNILKLSGIGALALMAVCAMGQSASPESAQQIPVLVNGQPIHFHDQGPVMSGDRVLVPLRGVLERMGARVDWDPSTQTVRADKAGSHVKLTIGQNTASVNGQPVNLDVPAQIVDGSTMVPLRFVGEALGNNVEWDAQDQSVEISTGDYNIPPAKTGHRPMRMDLPATIHAGAIINASLDLDINSDTNSRGEQITATVADGSLGLPNGTKLQGFVASARRRVGGTPGWLTLNFNKIILPNGNTYPVTGTFVSIGKQNAGWVHNAHFQSGTTFGVRLSNSIRFAK